MKVSLFGQQHRYKSISMTANNFSSGERFMPKPSKIELNQRLSEERFNMKKFNVNDRVYPPRVINGVWIQVNGAGTVKEVSDDG
jgi:hypothetical protein